MYPLKYTKSIINGFEFYGILFLPMLLLFYFYFLHICYVHDSNAIWEIFINN